jgi:hypothetical protein
MLNLGRLVVFVDPKETDIEIVAGILEVVRVATEKRNVLLWRKYQANVRVLFELVQVILATLEQRHHVAPHPSLL